MVLMLAIKIKSGFNIPKAVWINGPFKEFVFDTLSKEALSKIGYFNIAVVQRIINDHFSLKTMEKASLLCLKHICSIQGLMNGKAILNGLGPSVGPMPYLSCIKKPLLLALPKGRAPYRRPPP